MEGLFEKVELVINDLRTKYIRNNKMVTIYIISFNKY